MEQRVSDRVAVWLCDRAAERCQPTVQEDGCLMAVSVSPGGGLGEARVNASSPA